MYFFFCNRPRPSLRSSLFLSALAVISSKYSERVRTKAKAKTMEIMYGSLLVATGSSVS